MNEQQYQEICSACDQILRAPDSTIERVAISWLHIVREHPVFLNSYNDIYSYDKGIASTGKRCLKWLRSKIWRYRQIIRAISSGSKPWHESNELPEKIDILFVSHLLNPQQAGKSDDFYFGTLPRELTEQGYSVVIALLNHSGKSAKTLVEKWSDSLVPRVILSGSLGMAEESKLLKRLKRESFCLKIISRKESDSLLQKIQKRASKEALSGATQATLRISSQISSLVSRLGPSTLVTTYEGHAWERTVFAGARKECVNIQCIGYQHAALFRLQHAIRRNLAREYNPDRILTAGAVSKHQLESTPELAGTPITIIGSNRAIKPARNAAPAKTKKKRHVASTDAVCLVLPEGIESECHLLFGFSLSCAIMYPGIKFIWRLHPVIDYKKLAKKNKALRILPSNIVLSDNSIEEDITLSSCALYRGTTAIIQAIGGGLKPIYYELENEMTVDPLYELKVWRSVVDSVQDFGRVVNDDVNRNDNKAEQERLVAIKYCEDFFMSLDIGSFARVVEKMLSKNN